MKSLTVAQTVLNILNMNSSQKIQSEVPPDGKDERGKSPSKFLSQTPETDEEKQCFVNCCQ